MPQQQGRRPAINAGKKPFAVAKALAQCQALKQKTNISLAWHCVGKLPSARSLTVVNGATLAIPAGYKIIIEKTSSKLVVEKGGKVVVNK